MDSSFSIKIVLTEGEAVSLYTSSRNPIEITPKYSNIEHVCFKVTGDKLAVNISITCRSPRQTQELDIEMYHVLRWSLINNKTPILGDLNFPHTDWQTLTGIESESHRMVEFIDAS